MTLPLLATLADAKAKPLSPGMRSAELMRHGSMILRFYQPKATDPQTPHEQDEIYIVAGGRGTFVCAGQRVDFGPGDALFAPAEAVHRFENFTPDFAVWVIFYGPKGGENP